jgi:hypothetical protein
LNVGEVGGVGGVLLVEAVGRVADVEAVEETAADRVVARYTDARHVGVGVVAAADDVVVLGLVLVAEVEVEVAAVRHAVHELVVVVERDDPVVKAALDHDVLELAARRLGDAVHEVGPRCRLAAQRDPPHVHWVQRHPGLRRADAELPGAEVCGPEEPRRRRASAADE